MSCTQWPCNWICVTQCGFNMFWPHIWIALNMKTEPNHVSKSHFNGNQIFDCQSPISTVLFSSFCWKIIRWRWRKQRSIRTSQWSDNSIVVLKHSIDYTYIEAIMIARSNCSTTKKWWKIKSWNWKMNSIRLEMK